MADRDSSPPGGREPLLMLCHRIPYPPDKGDKIRSYHLLRYLADFYDVYLATFIDDPEDWRHRPEVEALCREVLVLARPRVPAPGPLWRCLARGEPLTLPLYHSAAMARWVADTVARVGICRALVFSSAMGQYLQAPGLSRLRRVVDFVDVDSDKWRQYAASKGWPRSWLYRREAGALRRYELELHAGSAASLFVSAPEAAVFRDQGPEDPGRVDFFNNGVDSDYFDPALPQESPYPEGARALVFTGAMDYWPNVDAVCWFARHCFPALRERWPDLLFYVVGSRPARAVRALEEQPGVRVTGRVADVRPYLRHCLAAVAPLRVARGIQNKVLEALAMSRPVLVSAAGLEGIPARGGGEVLLAEEPAHFERALEGLLEGRWPGLGEAGRALVLREFSWEHNLPVVRDYLSPGEIPAGVQYAL